MKEVPMKKLLTMGALLFLLVLALAPAQAEMRGYVKGQGYVYVHLGEYPYEADGTVKPLLWRVLEVRDNRALLLTEYIIDTSQIIFETDEKVIEAHSFRRINSFEESDLFPLLSTEYLDRMLGTSPLRNALIPEPNGATLFMLNDEAMLTSAYGFDSARWAEWPDRIRSHEAEGTPYAIKQRGLYVAYQNEKSSYWVATVKEPSDYKLQIVGFNGHLSYGAYTRVNIGLRLALRLDLNQVDLTGGDGSKDFPYKLAYNGTAPAPTAAPAITPAATEAPASPLSGIPEMTAEPIAQAAPETPAPTDIPLPTEAPAQESKNTVTLSFVGDCSIGDSEQYTKAASSYHTCLSKNGYAWPFSLVKDYLENDDLTVANLEVVFTTRTRHTDKKYNLVGNPEFTQVLKEGSVEMVNTVNNHCMDFLDAGYVESLGHLDEAGILHFGTIYPGLANQHDDLGKVQVGDLLFGFVGFSYPQDYDAPKIASRIAALRSQGCDVVIVSLHWGRETYMTPDSWQYPFARQIIDAGADMIWGHHPHVIQPIVMYKGKPILFSAGNFTFGTMSDVDPSTGIFQVTYEKTESGAELKQLRVIPCKTQPSPDFRPIELTSEKERQDVFKKLVLKKEMTSMQNPPASFLETGVIEFENGQMK